MSRSYKKYPSAKCEKSCKWGQRQANKRVRKTQNLANGGSYKKVFSSWNICDYKFVCFSKDEQEMYKKLRRK